MSNVDDIAFEGVEIKLDKVRRLKYTFKAVRILTKKYGRLQKAMDKLKFEGREVNDEALDIFATLIYAGLVHEDKDLTQDDVENMLDFRLLNVLPEKIMEAMSNSMPQPEPGNSQTQPGKK